MFKEWEAVLHIPDSYNIYINFGGLCLKDSHAPILSIYFFQENSCKIDCEFMKRRSTLVMIRGTLDAAVCALNSVWHVVCAP